MGRNQFTVGQLIRSGSSNGAVTVLELDDSGLVSSCKGATASLPSAVAGYAVGCIFIDTTTGHIYVNTGSATSCSFDDVGAVAAGEISLANGKVLIGNASGVAAAQSISSDITITNAGVATIATAAVSYAKMQDVSATNKVLGRSTAGAGDVEEIACTGAGRALLDDADAAAQLVTLGITPLAAAINLLTQGVAAGYKIARGTVTPVSASDTVVTGLATVVAVVASLKGAPTLTHMFVVADIGNQAGAPAAGSIYIKSYKPTAAADVTPVAATTPWSAVDWIAIGT